LKACGVVTGGAAKRNPFVIGIRLRRPPMLKSIQLVR
jgi:hypothetical protein